HDPSPIDEVMRLIALRAVDAAEVARVDGLDGEEDGLAPDTLALEEITDPRGNPAQVSEVIHGLLAPAEIRILYQAELPGGIHLGRKCREACVTLSEAGRARTCIVASASGRTWRPASPPGELVVDVSPENDGRSKLEYAGGFDGPSPERTGPMKRSKFAEEQVAYALRQAESGSPVGDVCRQLGSARPRSTSGRRSTRIWA